MESKPNGLVEFIERQSARALDGCTRCGKCFEVCPMPPYAQALQGASAAEVVGGILGMLRGEVPEPLALEWTRICTQSASCNPACPEQVNPMMMLRVARMRALGGFGAEPLMKGKDDPLFFQKILAFSKLQLSDAERAVWAQGETRR